MTLDPALKDAYTSMIRDNEYDCAVTLTTQPDLELPLTIMVEKLGVFDARVCKQVLGRRWNRKPLSDRYTGVYVLEYGRSGTYPHWHGLIKTPDGDLERYRACMEKAWGRFRGWSVFFETDPEKVADYSTKCGYILKEVSSITTDRIVFTNMLRRDQQTK